MIDQLFGSKTRVKLLKHFLKNPHESCYVREISRNIDEQLNSVRRELLNLSNIGIIKSETEDNKVFYHLNTAHKAVPSLSQILVPNYVHNPNPTTKKTITKISSIKPKPKANKNKKITKKPKKLIIKDAKLISLAERFRRIVGLQLVIVSGHFLSFEGIYDILFVGDMPKTVIEDLVSNIEDQTKEELKYVVLSSDDFDLRRKINDRFLSGFLQSKHEVILNKKFKDYNF